MLGFNDQPASVDWSYYGGAEELPPSLRPVSTGKPISASSSSSFSFFSKNSRTRPSRMRHTLSSSSTSTAFSSAYSSDVSTPGEEDVITPPTSDDELATLDEDQLEDKQAGPGPSSLRQRHVSNTAGTPPPAGARWMPTVGSQDETDFLWLLTEEPHRTRRAAIMKAHPEVKRLMGHEPLTKYVSLGVVLLQISVAVLLSRAGLSPLDWRFLLAAYAIGGTANQNIFLAIHEITHNLAFKGIKANKAWAILTNLPIGVPYAMMFKRYHIEHHKHLGEDGVDTDLPTKLELMCLKNVLGKAFFATFQIFFYALRPGSSAHRR